MDILVNNAAIRPYRSWSEVTVGDWHKVLATNLIAPFLLAQAVLGGMSARGHGRIINMSGVDAFCGKAGRIHVTTSKGGVIGMTRALALECGTAGVTVNAVVPGTIDTDRHSPEWYPDIEGFYRKRMERTPVGRLARPGEVADPPWVRWRLGSLDSNRLVGHRWCVPPGALLTYREKD